MALLQLQQLPCAFRATTITPPARVRPARRVPTRIFASSSPVLGATSRVDVEPATSQPGPVQGAENGLQGAGRALLKGTALVGLAVVLVLGGAKAAAAARSGGRVGGGSFGGGRSSFSSGRSSFGGGR